MPAMFWPASGDDDGQRCGGCDGHRDGHEILGGQLWCPAITKRETYNLGFSDGWDAGRRSALDALVAKAAVLAAGEVDDPGANQRALDVANEVHGRLATTRPNGPQKGPTVAEMGGG